MVANIENGNANKLDYQPDFKTNCLDVYLDQRDSDPFQPHNLIAAACRLPAAALSPGRGRERRCIARKEGPILLRFRTARVPAPWLAAA